MRKVDIRLYRIRRNMKSRCYNKNFPRYENYGGKGVKICDEWLDKETGFDNFYKWAIDNGYNDSLTIDRIDNDGDYCPENCRWVSKSFNSRRTQTSKISLDEADIIRNIKKGKSLRELAEEYNCSVSTIWSIKNNYHHIRQENARANVMKKYKQEV